MSIIVIIYDPRSLLNLLRTYYNLRLNTSKLDRINKESIYFNLITHIFKKIITDIPHLPLYLIFRITFINLLD